MEREVVITGAGGVQLKGTLALPDGKKPVAGMVLVAGSGPTDRNGNQLPTIQTDLLKQIAAGMAAQGVVSLRYDKRGIAASGPPPTDKKQWDEYFAWENFVGDVTAALAFLQKQPEVDAARTGILGHSEGGLLALSAATTKTNAAKPPLLLILAATPGRTLDAVIKEQLTSLLRAQGANREQTQFFLDKNAAISAEIKKTGKVPADVPLGLASLYPPYLGKFLRRSLAVNPAALAAAYPGPVLILQGGNDVQVSPTADARALDAALRRRPKDNHELAILSGLSHNFKRLNAPDDPAFAGPVAPEALEKINRWLDVFLVNSGR